MMRSLGVVCLLASCLAIVSPAYAQITTGGAIRGHVKDEQEAVLQGVRITATSPDASGAREVASDETGYYRLLDLSPGEYTITAELDGFAKWTRDRIVVRSGLNVDVPVVMKVGGVNETVQVALETPLIEMSTPTHAVNITGELQRAVPLSTKRLWTDYLLLTPAVIASSSTNFTVFYVHGATQDSHVFQLDGADMTSAVQSSNLHTNFSTDTISDVQVKTAAVDASAPLGLGAITSIAAPSGTDRLSGAATMVWHPRQWNGNNNPGGTPQTLDIRQVDLSAGGPLSHGRAWIFGTYRRTHHTSGIARTPQQLSAVRQVVPDFVPFDSSETGDFLFAKANVRLAASHELQGSFNSESMREPLTSTQLTDVFTRRDIGGEVYTGRLLSTWGASLTTRVLASYNTKGSHTISKQADRTSRAVYQHVIPSGPTLLGNNLLAVLDNYNAPTADFPDSKSTVSIDATYYRPSGIGSHELQTGVFFQPRIHDHWVVQYNNGGQHIDDFVLRDPSNPAAGYVPFHRRIMDVGSSTLYNVISRDLAVYAQDVWRPTSRLSVTAGLRIDLVRRVDQLFDEVTQDSTEFGPRLGAVFGLTADGRTAIRGSWGRVHENLSLNKTAAGSTVDGFRDLYDLDLDGTFETTLIQPSRTALASDRIIDLDRHHQAYANEWTAGVRRQWPGEIDTDVSVLRREYHDRPALVDTNAIYENGIWRGYRDPRFNQINLLTPNIWNRPVVTSVEFRASRQTRRLQLLASYTHQWRDLKGTWQPNDPASFIQPDAFRNSRGIGPIQGLDGSSLAANSMGFNAPWRDRMARIGISYSAPGGIAASAYLSYMSGVWSGPIYTTVPAADPRFGPRTLTLPNGRVAANPLATTIRFAYADRNEGQFTGDSIRQLNLRLGRIFRFQRYALELNGAVFNATNEDSDQLLLSGQSNALFSPLFRSGTRRQSPRSASVTARLSF